MSRKKIKKRARCTNGTSNHIDKFTMNTLNAVLDDSGEIQFLEICCEVDPALMDYYPLYQRAHQLMPESECPFMTRHQYCDYLEPALDVVQDVLQGGQCETDEVLRALALLGHTVDARAIQTLSTFSKTTHSLAPIAELALNECASLFNLFETNASVINSVN